MKKLLPILLFVGCASANQVQARDAVLHQGIAEVRHDGAYRCAPVELATAEADLNFAERQLSEGHPDDADRLTGLAEDAVQKARDLSKNCGPKEVIIQKPLVIVKIEAKDTDKDGIPDDLDRCPNDPGPKENFGCPWGDKDKDGIPDNLDKCPDVPGIPELQGCPDTDRDADGIPDRFDKCPDVPGVPPDGCPKQYKLVVVKKDRIEIKQQVHFQTARWKILKDSYELLNQVGQVLKDSPKIHVRIEGHTDNVGTAEKNQMLSQHRADSVAEFLVEHDIDPTRITAKGYGLTRPIASNASAIGRAQNRRVEFHIVKAGDSDDPPASDDGE